MGKKKLKLEDITSRAFTLKYGLLGSGLYAGVVIIDTSEIGDETDIDGLLYELKKIGIVDGREYQISNGWDILMEYDAYKKCKKILKRFNAKAVNL